MEEAWELAVVSYNQPRFEHEWSPRHVRLKFQMVSTALLYGLINLYGVGDLKLPFVDLQKDVSGELIGFLTLGFLVFTTISFLVRSQVERSRWPFQELSSWLDIWKFRKRALSFISATKGLENTAGEIEEAFVAQVDVFEKTRDAMYGRREFQPIINAFAEEIADLHFEGGRVSPVHPKFWSVLDKQTSKVKSTSTEVLRTLDELENIAQGYSSGNGQHDVDQMVGWAAEMRENVELASKSLRSRYFQLAKYSFAGWFQTRFLSVYLPLLSVLTFSLLPIFVGE